MKKFFGILFLIAGFTIAVSWPSFANSCEYYLPAIIISSFLFFAGLMFVITKSSSQRKKEAELNSIKNWSHSNAVRLTADALKHREDDEIFIQLEKLSKLKEKGILTEEEFQAQKKKILR